MGVLLMQKEQHMGDTVFSKGLKWGIFATFLTLTGCAEYSKRVLHDTEERGWEFNQALAKEYEILGNIEQEVMFDEYSAEYYYNKAIRSKEGYCVGPTYLENWDIDEDKLPELCKAREHLVYLLSLGARQVAPKMTARAQAHFDCWVEQQSEGWQEGDIAWCRTEFEKAVTALDVRLGVPTEMPAPTDDDSE
jgi:OOP family OmpA-OmpF porin